MYCTKCGKEIDNDSTFCPYCGQKTDAPVTKSKGMKTSTSVGGIQTTRLIGCVVVGLVFLIGVVFGVSKLIGGSDTKDVAKIEEQSEKTQENVISGTPEKVTESVEKESEEEPEVQPAEDLPVLSNYSIVRDDFSVNLDNGSGFVAYFDRVVFEGSDDNIVIWLNGQIESYEGTYQRETVDDIEGDLEILQEYNERYGNSAFYYSPHELSHIFYDDNYVSIGWSCEWFAGGVSNTNYEYVNYDLNSKAILKVTDLLGMNANNSIAQALNKIDESGYLSGQLQYISIEDIPFYFDTDTVYLNFPSYMLDQGTASIEVTLPRLVK